MVIRHYNPTLQGTEPAWDLCSYTSNPNLYPQDIFLIKILKYKAQNINSIELLNYQFLANFILKNSKVKGWSKQPTNFIWTKIK